MAYALSYPDRCNNHHLLDHRDLDDYLPSHKEPARSSAPNGSYRIDLGRYSSVCWSFCILEGERLSARGEEAGIQGEKAKNEALPQESAA